MGNGRAERKGKAYASSCGLCVTRILPMAPGHSAKNISMSVPRHNAQRTSLKFAVEIKKQARSRKILIDINMPHPELKASIVSVSPLLSLFWVYGPDGTTRKMHLSGVLYS